MSIQALNWALAQDQIANSAARFVLLILCNYANEAGQCYPSRETIARKTSLSLRSVQDQLNWLSTNGFIKWDARRNGQRQGSNIYQIQGAGFARSEHSQGANDVSQGANDDISQGATAAHYTSVREPSVRIQSGRAGITRNYTPINPSSDLELKTWMSAVAVAVGAADANSLPKFRKWELVCMSAIREQRDLGKLLSVIEAEKLRNQGQEEFFSPDTCLQKLQLNGSQAKPGKWMHDV